MLQATLCSIQPAPANWASHSCLIAGAPCVDVHAPLAGSKLAELLNNSVNSPRAPLPVRLRAAKLLGLCCAASPHVFRQYKASLEQVLQCESSGGCMPFSLRL